MGSQSLPQPYKRQRKDHQPSQTPRLDGELDQSLSPDGGLATQTLGAHCLKAVYGHPEVASPALCAQDLTSQDAWQEAYSQMVIPGPPGADVGPQRAQRTPAVGVCPRPAPAPTPAPQSP